MFIVAFMMLVSDVTIAIIVVAAVIFIVLIIVIFVVPMLLCSPSDFHSSESSSLTRSHRRWQARAKHPDWQAAGMTIDLVCPYLGTCLVCIASKGAPDLLLFVCAVVEAWHNRRRKCVAQKSRRITFFERDEKLPLRGCEEYKTTSTFVHSAATGTTHGQWRQQQLCCQSCFADQPRAACCKRRGSSCSATNIRCEAPPMRTEAVLCAMCHVRASAHACRLLLLASALGPPSRMTTTLSHRTLAFQSP